MYLRACMHHSVFVYYSVCVRAYVMYHHIGVMRRVYMGCVATCMHYVLRVS